MGPPALRPPRARPGSTVWLGLGGLATAALAAFPVGGGGEELVQTAGVVIVLCIVVGTRLREAGRHQEKATRVACLETDSSAPPVFSAGGPFFAPRQRNAVRPGPLDALPESCFGGLKLLHETRPLFEHPVLAAVIEVTAGGARMLKLETIACAKRKVQA